MITYLLFTIWKLITIRGRYIVEETTAKNLKNVYTGVKDRAKNVFKPEYEPKPEPVPA